MEPNEWEMLKKLGYPGDDSLSEGLYLGGENIVQGIIGTNRILPYNVEEIIVAGINSLSSQIKELKSANQIEAEIKNALQQKKGYSLIRIGDGELLTLAHDILLDTDEIKSVKRMDFLSYAGVVLPNHKVRDLLTENVLKADAVGIPGIRWPTFQQLFIKLAKHHKWDIQTMSLTESVINYDLQIKTSLYHYILTNYKVLLIGNRMKEGEELLRNLGYKNIAGSIPVKNIHHVPDVLQEAKRFDFTVALVSAGIPANIICVELAKQKKVAIDFGHLIDELIKKTKFIHP
jgi:hypothetical protein